MSYFLFVITAQKLLMKLNESIKVHLIISTKLKYVKYVIAGMNNNFFIAVGWTKTSFTID